MSSQAKLGRGCSRVGCRSIATMTLTYIYAESMAVVGPLATFSEPHAYDLCLMHGERLKVPHGWSVIKQEPSGAEQGPSDDDLMAIADAVREVAMPPSTPNAQENMNNDSSHTQIGRRGHLRAVPS
ncbi:MAG: hypothetical protein CK518_03515 [Actinobacteria bacterium]|nr:DUF3499 domain-containing protein [Candidatus Planktophila sp.]PHX66582.1 MAG: hypothetical protein CK518_03515 [Actinomycetota bacterium]